MHTKMLAFLGSFVVLTVKFMLYKKWQRKYGPPLCTPFSIERSAATTLFQPLLRLLTALFPAALLTLRGGRWAGRYWEPTLEGTPSSETSSTYLHVGLPTKDFLILTDYKVR